MILTEHWININNGDTNKITVKNHESIIAKRISRGGGVSITFP